MASQTQSVPKMTSPQAAATSNLDKSFDMQAALLLAAIENSAFGLIIVSQNGTLLHKNKHAQTLLGEMTSPSSTDIPDVLWRSCQTLIHNKDDSFALFPTDYTVVLEDEITTQSGTLYARVQWFDWDDDTCQSDSCFLITLENRQRSLTVIANQEAQRYGLTTRERDVWRLKRMGNSYKEIANRLYISENTVKKHVKNIYSKKEQSAW